MIRLPPFDGLTNAKTEINTQMSSGSLNPVLGGMARFALGVGGAGADFGMLPARYMESADQHGYYEPVGLLALNGFDYGGQVFDSTSNFVDNQTWGGFYDVAGDVINIGTLAYSASSIVSTEARTFQMNFRMGIAEDFYSGTGWSPERIESHMNGIDFTRSVTTTALLPGESFEQWQTTGRSAGNYLAPPGSDASSLGVNPAGRQMQLYTPTTPIPALKTTAAPVLDTWSAPGQPFPAKGGGTQFFIRNPGDLKALQP